MPRASTPGRLEEAVRLRDDLNLTYEEIAQRLGFHSRQAACNAIAGYRRHHPYMPISAAYPLPGRTQVIYMHCNDCCDSADVDVIPDGNGHYQLVENGFVRRHQGHRVKFLGNIIPEEALLKDNSWYGSLPGRHTTTNRLAPGRRG